MRKGLFLALFLLEFTGMKTTLLATCLLLSSALPASGHAQQYSAYMYKNDHRNVPVGRFSPNDAIGVLLTLKDLSKGDYTLHVDWYDASGKLQDSDRHRFTEPDPRTEVFEAELKIIKASPLRRLFSASEATGYHMRFYGKWQVKIFLNGEKVISKDFHVE